MKSLLRFILAAGVAAGSIEAATGATSTATLNVSMTIQSSCSIATQPSLAFASSGALNTSIDATTTFNVQCTNSTPYTIGLDAGSGGGTTSVRKMKSGGASATTLDYTLWRDANRTLNWGNTIGTDTLSGTGNGVAQTLTIFGRVPAQTTPAAGLYTDTVTITLNY